MGKNYLASCLNTIRYTKIVFYTGVMTPSPPSATFSKSNDCKIPLSDEKTGRGERSLSPVNHQRTSEWDHVSFFIPKLL